MVTLLYEHRERFKNIIWGDLYLVDYGMGIYLLSFSLLRIR